MPVLLLAAVAPTPQSGAGAFDLLIALGLIAAFAAVGGVAIIIVRRALRAPPPTPGGFSFGDLRELRDAGEITPEEFEAARASIIAHAKRPASGADATGRKRNGS